ncbi:MAG: hypothetical protein BHW42_06955 [Oscillibacter sp. CAG:241_62_21]|nr:MAG: hypothetical protein BHW42_06955 [Oscillibacter sp. CAG:241_62_21]
MRRQWQAKQGPALADLIADWFVESRKDGEDAAERYFRRLAEGGDPAAQWWLGVSYQYGVGAPKDRKNALRWFRQAARQGNARAQESLRATEDSAAGGEDSEKLQIAAEQGSAQAQYRLGYRYWNGDGVERDERQAADWFDRAARQGLAPAQRMLGRCYEQGRGVERDARQAVAWYRWAATQGDPEAQYALGVCLDKGLGTEENAAEAFAWYKNAAAQGLKKAQLALADCYEKGRGVPKNSSLAREWRKAADKD